MTASSVVQDVDKHPSAKEERKMRKPLIERKRRERINNCLDQLKETVIGAFRLDQSKLEKADILEMTVKHLQNIQNSQMPDPTLGLEAQQRYSTGYIQCMHEVHNMLLTCDWMDKTLGSRLLNHLLKSLPRSTDDSSRNQPRHDALLDVPLRSVLATPLRGLPKKPRQKEGSPPLLGGQQERPELHSSHLSMMEMWRPW
ncbi:transcription cofactor HES-6-like [Oryzias latipes]|uniref:Hairy-related 8.2 n=1 Tax=Oryzias latipes TaxID=8090 RepID=H2MKT8_ORYLA|nr:transcription cofactor HES-6-like [Oryzias latipes]XP_020564194.1 transcription cofactor HES-6-like [Oryzias latipes]